MVNFKINIFGGSLSKDYYDDFNQQIKCVKDSVLTLEEAIKLFEKDCLNEMEDKCKIISELEKEAKNYQDKLRDIVEKGQFLGPDNIDYGRFTIIMGEIGENVKSASELLINLKGERIPKEISMNLIKLIEIDESISRDIYLTLKKLDEADREKINKLSTKIEKKQKEAYEISDYIIHNFNNYFNEENLSESLKDMITILKKISEEAQNVASTVK
ncbi:MAG: DUF47 family protein [Candidatus Methanofastidiosa archaeon]|jgi:uncharacterized protein Yka (UPF0111/DUF47 family)|nr:DUF47 family protein [Candidatus Methanofastidiosa archaeon]